MSSRISTVGFQTNAVDQMDALQAALAKTQNQLGSGQRIMSAADDPTGMAQVNQYNIELSASQQYVTNQNAASTNLTLEEQALSDATNVLQSARDLAVQANNSSLTAVQRGDIATQLQQQLEQLVAIGNRTDSNGNYLFSGYAAGTKPFAQSGASVSYSGATGVSQIQVSANQRISSGDSGDSVFMNVPAGNGTFTTSTGVANTGTGWIDPGSITNPSQWVPDTYTISFTSPTQYQVVNSANAVVANGTYTSGGSVNFLGAQVTISGAPAAGDQFTVAAAGKASAFATLSGLITTLSTPGLNTAQITTQIGGALAQMDGAITNLGVVSASVGARLNSISATQTTEQAAQMNLQGSISKISDLDYAAATTQLSTEELALQAAQTSYASLGKLSLFDYIR
jgi:flagellar hook-associated protein 3 FlgL